MNKIKKLSIPDHTRVIVISDIHGELELFKELLGKVDFSEEDYLIINGDLCEKGGNSQGTLNYIMDLATALPNVYVTEGNCDSLAEDLLNQNPELIGYLCVRPHSIFNEWLEDLGYSINEESNVKEIREILTGQFSKEIEWLIELPTAIETDDYIFVHAGLEDIENWQDTERDTAITMPAFLEKSHRTGKYVIVGHYPAVNYALKYPSYNPIIDREKKIIAIDGGNVIKKGGQLNALIIDRSSSGDTFSHTYVDHLPKGKVVKDFRANPSVAGAIRYPLFDVEPVEKNAYFTLCRQLKTNQLLHVKNEYLYQDENGSFHAKDVSCTQISVSEGDIVSVIDDRSEGYSLIKKDGVEGWVAKDSLR